MFVRLVIEFQRAVVTFWTECEIQLVYITLQCITLTGCARSLVTVRRRHHPNTLHCVDAGMSVCVDECTDEWMDGTKEGRKGLLRRCLPSPHLLVRPLEKVSARGTRGGGGRGIVSLLES